MIKLIFLIICLIIVLLTLENLIVSGFHSYGHRLLPLILGLLALYDFYLIVEHLTGAVMVFTVLKDLLLIQLLDVIIYYILDFMKIKIKMIYNVIIIALLIYTDILVFAKIEDPDKYRLHVNAITIVSTIVILVLTIVTAKKRYISKQTKRNNTILFYSLLIPAVSLVLCMLGVEDEEIVMPIALCSTCILLDYLFFTDRLRDVDSVLKEEHFQTLDVPAFLFDKDLFYLDSSQKAKELFGAYMSEFNSPKAESFIKKELEALMEKNGIDYRLIEDRYYKINLQKALYKGKMKGYILTFMDVTEQKNEADIAKDIAKQKSEFLANMSHDLRSPLHAIIGSSEIVLSRIEMSERTRVMVNHIHEAGNNLLDIVNSILDFSKLESNGLHLHPSKYNFKKLVEEQAHVGFANLNNKPIKLVVEIENDYPEFLFGDELRVRQIVQNLISNATKFTDRGSIECRFKVSIEADNRVRIDYSVKDSGIGMTKEQIDNVFKDYVTYANEHKKEGTGLGLSIVRKLSELMSGSAYANSDGKNGSTVGVIFYQDLVEVDEKNGIELQSPLYIDNINDVDDVGMWKNVDLPTKAFPNAKVLIADDMLVNCEIFKEMTAPWKFEVNTAADGKQAIALVKRNHYDLIFLDQMMPVMTGTEAADEIKEITDTPMILLTANITEAMRDESIKHGFSEFMQKPIDIAVLKEYIEKYMPEELAEEISENELDYIRLDNNVSKNYQKNLETYVGEMKELYEVLPDYANNHLDLFRNKVHGIKGVSRQLGKENIALLSEIMEMAAITENKRFIESYFDTFYKDLEYIISSCEKELERLKIADEDEEIIRQEVGNNEVKKYFEELRQLLVDYEVSATEDILEEISAIKLEGDVLRGYKSIVNYFEEMEYENAISEVELLLSNWK